jgi:uncharacterized protein YjdB
MKKNYIFLSFVLLFSILFHEHGYGQCMSGWLYKMPVTVNNPGATILTNYQVSITVNTQALITAGKMNAAGNDIRFSDGVCTNLPYWIESGINTASTVIWINDNTIPTGNSTIFMYYSNPAAPAASDGNATFIIFDDFNGASLDLAKWTKVGTGNVVVSGGAVTMTTPGGNDQQIRTNTSLPFPYKSEIKVNSQSGNWPNMAEIDNGAFSGNGAVMYINGGNMGLMAPTVGCNSYSVFFGNEVALGATTGIWSLVRTATTSTATWPGGSNTASVGGATVNQTSIFGLLCSGNGSMAVDWFRARKYSATGTTQTLGAETFNPNCVTLNASWSNETGNVNLGANAFSVTGYSGSNLADAGMVAAADPNTGYINRTALAAVNLQQGGVYPASLTWGVSSSHQITQVWIDFNNDGIFAPSEEVSPVSGWPVSQPTNFNITIPVTATTGQHMMRVRAIRENNATDLGAAPAHVDPCLIQYPGITLLYSSGDEADYIANIICLPVTAGTITGNMTACPGTSTALTDVTGSIGTTTWASSNTNVATVGATGIVNGLIPGTSTINFTVVNSCGTATAGTTVTINPLPSAINGPSGVCLTSLTNYTDPTAFGAWSSSNTTVASVGSGSGVVTATTTGSSTLTYTLVTGCTTTKAITVNPLPNPISGSTSVCLGSTAPLSDAGGGTWTSFDLSKATIGLSSGIVTGVGAGTSGITYTLPTGCTANTVMTVNPLPNTVIAGGGGTFCDHTTITAANGGSGTIYFQGTTSGGTSTATASTSQLITVSGTYYFRAQSALGCWGTEGSVTVTINPLPVAITGGSAVCTNSMLVLSDASTGGTWTSSNTSVASIDMSNGTVTGNTAGGATITYTLPTTCRTTKSLTVNPLPMVSAGSNVAICNTFGTNLNPSGANSYTWSPAYALSCTNCANPVASPTMTVTYTVTGTLSMSTGCSNTAMVTVSVNPLPDAINGNNVCVGSTTTLSDAGGGTWSIDNTAVATIDMSSGALTGITASTANVTYTLPFTGCTTSEVITVNPLPSAITGNAAVCVGLTTTLSDDPGGSWSSDNTSLATVDPVTGIVTGVSAGMPDIIFTLMATGCMSSVPVTVNPLPAAISGNSVCFGSTTTLTDATSGGVWTNDNTAIATIDSFSGFVTAVAVGSNNTSYILPTGCLIAETFTVNPLPSAILGTTTVCPGMTITLTDAGGGSWTSGNTSIATVVAGTGIVTGVAAGSAMITYTLPTSCMISTSVHVLPAPRLFTVTGGGHYCSGDTGVVVNLSGSDTGYHYHLWHGATPVDTLAGTDSALHFDLQTLAGNYTVQAMNDTTGCTSIMTNRARVTIDPLPGIHTVTGGGTFCAGGIGVPVGLDGSFTAIAYKLYDGGTFIDSLTGTNAALDFGLQTAGGIYKVVATNITTGCTRKMADSAIVVVNPLLTPMVSIYPHDKDTVCQGSLTTFIATSVFGGPAPEYQWSVNGATVGFDTLTYSYVPKNGDVVSVVLKSDTTCLKTDLASSEVTMTVDIVYIPTVTISGFTGAAISKGQTITLTAGVTNGGPSPKFQWLKAGIPIAGATNATYTSTFANKDSITVIVLGTAKCGTPSFNSIIMVVTTAGVTEIGQGIDMTVIPNPNNGAFVLKGTTGTGLNEEVSLEVTNMVGQVIYKNQLTAHEGAINEEVQLGNIANGMYLLNVISGNEHKVFHIVVKQ